MNKYWNKLRLITVHNGKTEETYTFREIRDNSHGTWSYCQSLSRSLPWISLRCRRHLGKKTPQLIVNPVPTSTSLFWLPWTSKFSKAGKQKQSSGRIIIFMAHWNDCGMVEVRNKIADFCGNGALTLLWLCILRLNVLGSKIAWYTCLCYFSRSFDVSIIPSPTANLMKLHNTRHPIPPFGMLFHVTGPINLCDPLPQTKHQYSPQQLRCTGSLYRCHP
jgi:hypothetical protein